MDIDKEIKKAWGYSAWYREEYDNFGEFFQDYYNEISHREEAKRYKTAAYKLESLVEEIR